MLQPSQSPSSPARPAARRASLRGLAGACALAAVFVPVAAFSVPSATVPTGYTLSTYATELPGTVFNLTMDPTTRDIYYDSSSTTVFRIAASGGAVTALGNFQRFNPFVATDISYADGAAYMVSGGSLCKVTLAGDSTATELPGQFSGECGSAVIGTVLYGTGGGGGGTGLARVDLLTGAATTLGEMPSGLSSLEYNAVDGFLYAVQLGAGDAGTFYKINPTTGVATPLPQPSTGAFNYSFGGNGSGEGDFAIQPDGQFFVFRNGGTIYQYDSLTGATVPFVTDLPDVGSANDLTFGPSSAVPGGWSLYFANGAEIEELAGFSGPFSGTAVNDAVTSTNGATVVYPLANDIGYPSTAMITSLTDAAGVTIAADGRSLVLPAGFAGTFTYETNQGTSASVVVTAGTPAVNARRFSGLLYSSTGALAGWTSLSVSPKGSVTGQFMVGGSKAKAMFAMKSTDPTGGGLTSLGALSIVRNADGTISATLAANGGDLTGTLRPSALTNTAARQHLAFASTQSAYHGGGYAMANRKTTGSEVIVGVLPDGRPFSAAGYVSDNGTTSFYAVESKFVLPAGIVGGELVDANLPTTDVTGELAWSKPAQGPGAKGNHLGGVNTVLTANGSLYNGALLLDGPGLLTLSGGNLVVDETGPVLVTLGLPVLPTGSLKGWAGVKVTVGQFRAKVQVPGFTKPVTGGGVYLPKSQTAWGYFPGTTVGGRIELTTAIN